MSFLSCFVLCDLLEHTVLQPCPCLMYRHLLCFSVVWVGRAGKECVPGLRQRQRRSRWAQAGLCGRANRRPTCQEVRQSFHPLHGIGVKKSGEFLVWPQDGSENSSAPLAILRPHPCYSHTIHLRLRFKVVKLTGHGPACTEPVEISISNLMRHLPVPISLYRIRMHGAYTNWH